MSEVIRVTGLEKSFFTPAGELKVLKGIDAVFHQGEMVSIIGASGVGKSTFLHVLGTLDRPTAGGVSYHLEPGAGGIDPFSLTDGQLAAFRNRAVGFVFQFHYLLPEFSALENVLMPGLIAGAHRQSDGHRRVFERAEHLLDELGLTMRKHHKPGELSGGEQQRVAVARALLQEPRVILADEPTGNLDIATGESLFGLLQEINSKRGVTFVIVTHNPALSARCSRVLEMVDGRLSDVASLVGKGL